MTWRTTGAPNDQDLAHKLAQCLDLIVKAYDVRGTYPDLLTDRMGWQIGCGSARFLLEEAANDGESTPMMRNVIIGRDMLDDLGINLRFSDNVIEWDEQEVDFRPEGTDEDFYAATRIPDTPTVEEAIYDDAMRPSTYEAATTKDILPTLTQLSEMEKEHIGQMFDRFKSRIVVYLEPASTTRI